MLNELSNAPDEFTLKEVHVLQKEDYVSVKAKVVETESNLDIFVDIDIYDEDFKNLSLQITEQDKVVFECQNVNSEEELEELMVKNEVLNSLVNK